MGNPKIDPTDNTKKDPDEWVTDYDPMMAPRLRICKPCASRPAPPSYATTT
jgi:hypothetical protein